MKDGATCVMHPDSGLFVRARDLTPDEWRRLVEMEAATRAVVQVFNPAIATYDTTEERDQNEAS